MGGGWWLVAVDYSNVAARVIVDTERHSGEAKQ
jgi:hypothetical protein